MEKIDAEEFIEYLKKGEIPPVPPRGSSENGYDNFSAWSDGRDKRADATDRGMWAIIDKIWTKELSNWIGERSCLEVMAGAGWLSKALSQNDIDIIATDNGSWDERHSKIVFVHPIEKLDAISAVKKYKNRDILIISWPPYGDETIINVCKEWGNVKPVVYIGEECGCNAPDEFFEHFKEVVPQPNIHLMCWSGIHDKVIIGYYQ